MTITSFSDRATCRMLAADIEKVLAAVAEKYGIAIRYKGGSFTAGNFTAKIECAVIADGGLVKTKEATDFEALAQLYGLLPTDLGRTFQYGGAAHTVVGLKNSASKAPILGRRADGKTYRFPADAVRNALAFAPNGVAQE